MLYKHNKSRSQLGAVLLAICALSVVSSAVIGFDFGSSFMKATLVQPGKSFQIIENTASKRKTETMISLGNENRLFGADSLLEMSKYPQNTFSQVTRIFGKEYNEEWVAKFKKERMVFNEFVADERGQIAWKVTKP